MGVLANDVDEVGHGEIEDAVLPCQLHDGIGLQKVVACVRHGREALLVLGLNEVGQECLHELLVGRLC